MGWRRRWPEKSPRPKVKPLSKDERDRILKKLNNGVESSPVLSSLGIRVRALRGRFYIERSGHDSDGQLEVEALGRITPLASSSRSLLLEVDKGKGNWYEAVKGSAKKIMDSIATDTKGTFHGLGALDKSLRGIEADRKRLDIEMHKDLRFVYANSGEACTAQEVLFHFCGVPMEIIIQPRAWYRYHRKPAIVEVSEDRTRVLVRFTATTMYGLTFGGTCLYVMMDNTWHAFTIKPDRSSDIATALAWLEKRGWNDWG